MSRNKVRLVLAIALALPAACTQSDAQNERGRGGPAEVGFVVAQRTSVPIQSLLGGRTVAFESSEVRPQVNGLIRQRYFTLKDFSSQGRAYFSDDFDFEPAAVNKNLRKEPRLRELLPGFAERLEQLESFTAETAEATLRSFAEEQGVKAGLLINGSRTMLTGQAVGPSMFEVFDILGQRRSVERLRSGVPWFDSMNALGDV